MAPSGPTRSSETPYAKNHRASVSSVDYSMPDIVLTLPTPAEHGHGSRRDDPKLSIDAHSRQDQHPTTDQVPHPHKHNRPSISTPLRADHALRQRRPEQVPDDPVADHEGRRHGYGFGRKGLAPEAQGAQAREHAAEDGGVEDAVAVGEQAEEDAAEDSNSGTNAEDRGALGCSAADDGGDVAGDQEQGDEVDKRGEVGGGDDEGERGAAKKGKV
ncbi:hypothetical protein BG005_006930 [Podila minutissima]|nr:hypothetical protein BG005_006930 [Podila minutissima]